MAQSIDELKHELGLIEIVEGLSITLPAIENECFIQKYLTLEDVKARSHSDFIKENELLPENYSIKDIGIEKIGFFHFDAVCLELILG